MFTVNKIENVGTDIYISKPPFSSEVRWFVLAGHNLSKELFFYRQYLGQLDYR
jgi:hypothetical protein